MCSASNERDATLGRQPRVVGEIRDVDDERVAVPTPDRIASIRRRLVVAMRPTVGRHELIVVKGFG
jgi:hypothetical protein